MRWIIHGQKSKTSNSWMFQNMLCSIMGNSHWDTLRDFIFLFFYNNITIHAWKVILNWTNQSTFTCFMSEMPIFINFKFPLLLMQENVGQREEKWYTPSAIQWVSPYWGSNLLCQYSLLWFYSIQDCRTGSIFSVSPHLFCFGIFQATTGKMKHRSVKSYRWKNFIAT